MRLKWCALNAGMYPKATVGMASTPIGGQGMKASCNMKKRGLCFATESTPSNPQWHSQGYNSLNSREGLSVPGTDRIATLRCAAGGGGPLVP